MGGVTALTFFLLCGAAAAQRLFSDRGIQTRIWLGLSAGFMMMLVLPSAFAFAFRFTAAAQYAAMAAALLFAAAARYFARGKDRKPPARNMTAEPPVKLTLVLVLPLLALSAYLQYTHVLLPEHGGLSVGQSTYGDLCLHLGIATGLRGASFPPEYTLLPGTPLGYPFLMDALSASMMVLGSSLRLSFILPAVLATGLVYLGFILFAWEIARSRGAVALAFLLTFLNGGLGFLYLFDFWPSDSTRIFEALFDYYRAPTNMPELNLLWVNAVCDLLIPQRTLLAGWAVVIPALYLLVRAVRTGRRKLFVILGVWAGLMPMVHTHSFTALALISAGCMAGTLIREKKQTRARTLQNFLWYGGIAAMLSLPQMIYWTFPQTIGGGSLKFLFNWVNWGGDGLIDGYLWFWVKNVGPIYLLMVPAALSAPKKLRPLTLGALAVYAAAETIQFQPNIYDNNKLFYVAFLTMTPFVGRYLRDIYVRLAGVRGRAALAAVFLTVSLSSGALSIAREAISSYELFSPTDVAAAEFAEQNTPAGAVFLTGTRHNNPFSSLAGKKLVCGTAIYLYYHGVDYDRQVLAVKDMYERPEDSKALFSAYGVDYICLSAYERSEFEVDEAALRALYPAVFEMGDTAIFAVSQRTAAAP